MPGEAPHPGQGLSDTDWESATRFWWAELRFPLLPYLQRGEFTQAVLDGTRIVEGILRAVSDAQSETDLPAYALYDWNTKRRGVITQHLTDAEAKGIANLYRGIWATYRNAVHHDPATSLLEPEATGVLHALNLLITRFRAMAHETYLRPFVSRFDVSYLLRVRSHDLDGNGAKERIVTFAEKVGPATVGSVLVLRETEGVLVALPRKVMVPEAYLGGDIVIERSSNRPLVLAVFVNSSGLQPVYWAVAFYVDADAVKLVPLEDHCRPSVQYPHELVDVLGLGTQQILNVLVNPEGVLVRQIWERKGDALHLASHAFLGPAMTSPLAPVPEPDQPQIGQPDSASVPHQADADCEA